MAAETGIIGLTAFILFLIKRFCYLDVYRDIVPPNTQAERAHPQAGFTDREAPKQLCKYDYLPMTEPLSGGNTGSISVCVHNFVDNLCSWYEYLFALPHRL